MASYIGIKIANGEFYPIVEEDSNVRKRLVLTTVHDGQRSVQIDLYKSEARTMADAVYIGSLVVENISPKPKGDPSIELVIASSGGDEISAEALDLDSPDEAEKHMLNVSLQALDEDSTYEIPDFELEPETVPPEGLLEKTTIREETYTERKRGFLLPLIIIVLVIILIGAIVWLLFGMRGDSGGTVTRTTTPVQEQAAETESEPEPVLQEEKEPVVEPAPPPVVEEVETQPEPAVQEEVPAPPPPAAAPAARDRDGAPVKSYNVPLTIPPEGARYTIRWGDTLWDISEAFYRNPWLYPRIARYNNIRNPDLIISGTSIRIPPRN